VSRRPRLMRLLRVYLFRTRKLTRRQLGTLQDWKMRLVFWLGALLVGVLIVGFARAAEWSSHQFVLMSERWPLAPLLVTPLGMVSVAWLMRKLVPAAQGSGIPQVLVSLKQRYRWLRPAFLGVRVIIGKLVLTCFGLMVGGSIGREGPSVHIGAAVMHNMGRMGQLKQKAVDNALIVGGGAAGVSAAFNAPLAGIVFAVEELSQSLEQRNSGTLILSIFLSGVVVLILSGHYSYFGNPDADLLLTESWPSVLVTGLVCGVLGGLFGRILLWGTRALAPHLHAAPLKVALLCGLIVALIGHLTGGSTFGSGYEQARALLAEEHSGDWLFPLAKMAATLASYFSGIPGGIFSPSLAAGAGVGAAVGNTLSDAAVVGLTVVGMSSFLAAVIQRPLVSFVIVMELTGNRHDMLMSLMMGSILAFVVSRLLVPRPLFDALADDLIKGRAHPVEKTGTERKGAQADASSP
jgi:H+/Cl- antiporter ClcA